MQVRWSPRATRDFEAIVQYIADDSPAAATGQARKILKAIRQLEAFPESGPKGYRKGNRRLVVPGTPYILRYKLEKDVVKLNAIVHGAMQYADRF